MLLALIQAPPAITGPSQINVYVQYYDDADPVNAGGPSQFIEQVSMPFLSSATEQTIKDAVIARGRELAVTQSKAGSLKGSFPMTIAVA